jgi:ubiquinone/menaquinone biosynthesis C-methylase UbiE
MMKSKLSEEEKKIMDYYEKLWSFPIQLKNRVENPLLGFHYGFYEKGIKNWEEAAINMNDLVGRLLHLDNKKGQIIDLGCGSGSTLAFLALKYPNIKFHGITLASSEANFAKNLQKEKNLDNIEITLGNFVRTNYSNGRFDGIYALESFCYAKDKIELLDEMKRLLKSGGKLVIIDGFLTDRPFGSFMKVVYQSLLSRRSVPHLMSVNDLELYLKKEFKGVNFLDLSKNSGILYNFLQQDYIRIFIKFFYIQLKRTVFGKTYVPKKDMDYLWGALVPELFLGINKKIGYYAITAIKN